MREPSFIELHHITSECLDRALGAIEDDPASKEALKQIEYLKGGFLLDGILRNKARSPLRSVIRIIRQRYNCFGVAEWPYFDLDVWEGFCLFYSYSFKQYKRASRRIHFFEGPDSKAEAVIRALKYGKTLSQIERIGVKYRGFTVIRPLNSFVVGRTALKFDERKPNETVNIDKHPLEQTGIPFCKGEFTQEAHVCSTTLKVQSAPFIQQDPVIGVCASASIWAASQMLANRFGLHKFPYGTITQQAFYSRTAPSFPARKDTVFGPGLTIQHISDALAFTGANPLLVFPAESQGLAVSLQARFRLLTYTFVESGIPAILCFTLGENSGHAVTLLGHLLPGATDASDAGESEAELTFGSLITHRGRHRFVGQAVQLYYAHDDAYGPFSRIRMLSEKEALKTRARLNRDGNPLKNMPCLLSLYRQDNPIAGATALVVGLPRYVQNSPEGVMIHAIKEFDNRFPDLPAEYKVLWRCLLVETSTFKRELFASDRHIPYTLGRKYATLHLPKYVWLVEFSIGLVKDNTLLTSRRKVDGEFLYDPTTPYWEPNCLTQRFWNYLIDLRENKGFEKAGPEPISVPCFIGED